MTSGREAVMDCGELHNDSLQDDKRGNGTPLWGE